MICKREMIKCKTYPGNYLGRRRFVKMNFEDWFLHFTLISCNNLDEPLSPFSSNLQKLNLKQAPGYSFQGSTNFKCLYFGYNYD